MRGIYYLTVALGIVLVLEAPAADIFQAASTVQTRMRATAKAKRRATGPTARMGSARR